MQTLNQSANANANETESLTKQISQLFGELVSVWRDTDIKKNQAVRMLAARMEEYFLQVGQEQEVKYICKRIRDKLSECGLGSTAHHVEDYLDDKYKQLEFSHHTGPESGAVDDKILLEFEKLNPLDISHDDKIKIVEALKKKRETREKQQQSEEHFAKSILEAAKVQKQAMNYDEDSFTNSTGQDYESVGTDNPKRNYVGPVHQAWDEYHKAVDRYATAVKNILDDFKDWCRFETPEEKQLERNLTRAIMHETEFFETWTEVHSPLKDLKYGTSTRNWWLILMKFLDHGKHAAAVMDPIVSHRNPKDKRPYTREQVGDEVYLKEQLLEKYGENRDFCNYIKDYFINHPDKLYDKDETVLMIRKDYIGKLITLYASKPDFFKYACDFREREMDPRVASRRIDAKPILSKQA